MSIAFLPQLTGLWPVALNCACARKTTGKNLEKKVRRQKVERGRMFA